MHWQRPRPRAGVHPSIGSVTVGIAAVLALTSCSSAGDGDEDGPPRLTPNPQHDVAAAMVDGRAPADGRLSACELLGLSTEEVIDLTDASMPDVEPTGSGDLGLICTYGGPGSRERAETAAAEATTTTQTTSPQESSTPDPDPDADQDGVPDTVAAGVVAPRGGAGAALEGQAALLGVRYACSEIRGAAAPVGEDLPVPAPGAPGPVRPTLATSYIDCTATPTGGGVEVHTILAADDQLWHLTMLRPEIPRSEESEGTALAALHRIAATLT